VRFQFPDGYHIAPHTHPKTERVTVISGNLYLATGETLDRIARKNSPPGPSVTALLDETRRLV
jgi:quercetin dioxygenase-like cupin family protein